MESERKWRTKVTAFMLFQFSVAKGVGAKSKQTMAGQTS